MDNVLVPYLTAGDDQERQQHLNELLTLRAAPLIRQVLRRRLGFYVNTQGGNQNYQDAEDLYQEAITRVLQVLTQLQSSSEASIENFQLYVSRIAANTCADFLRAKSPAHSRLKFSLRDLLKRHKDLVSWARDGEILCGFASWRNTAKSPFSDQSLEDLETKLDSFKSLYFGDEDIRLAPLSKVVAELFDWILGPVELDILVRMIAYLLEIKEQELESLDDPLPERWEAYFAPNTESIESYVEANELVARLWQTVIQLPAEQRDAFTFGFENQAGQDLFTHLLAAGIVNWDELAQGMGRSVEEIVRLQLRMPLDISSVAEELRASRENIYKWRFRAIRRLKTELRR